MSVSKVTISKNPLASTTIQGALTQAGVYLTARLNMPMSAYSIEMIVMDVVAVVGLIYNIVGRFRAKSNIQL